MKSLPLLATFSLAVMLTSNILADTLEQLLRTQIDDVRKSNKVAYDLTLVSSHVYYIVPPEVAAILDSHSEAELLPALNALKSSVNANDADLVQQWIRIAANHVHGIPNVDEGDSASSVEYIPVVQYSLPLVSREFSATNLVEQMRGHSMQTSGMGPSMGSPNPEEQHRQEIVDRLRKLGTSSVLPLAGTLTDPDAQMRRNAELVLMDLAGPYERKPQVDIRAAITATTDSDTMVRAWAATALAEIGPDAQPAIPALTALLKDTEEAPREAGCIALGNIGPAAHDALPLLRQTLHDDPSKDVRQFAERAIDKITAEHAAPASLSGDTEPAH